ncbi:MAG: hypothetical protein IT436_13275 [Phycisphaerales bacterium]|nr:hypothetical protein [Phycisphaerales bacterium]
MHPEKSTKFASSMALLAVTAFGWQAKESGVRSVFFGFDGGNGAGKLWKVIDTAGNDAAEAAGPGGAEGGVAPDIKEHGRPASEISYWLSQLPVTGGVAGSAG